MYLTRQIISTCAIALIAGSASADTVAIFGDASSSIENTGAKFTGSVGYDFVSGNTGTLTVSLTNTTPESVGGFLTGFAFDIASIDASASATLFSATNTNFLNTGEEDASPFGTFDAGAALRANWSGGGNPNFGIPAILGVEAGTTETFIFTVSASDASTLSAASFLGDSGNWFAVRFRGLNDGGSDKLLVNVVPLPTSALAGLGMLGLGLGIRTARRRR